MLCFACSLLSSSTRKSRFDDPGLFFGPVMISVLGLVDLIASGYFPLLSAFQPFF